MTTNVTRHQKPPVVSKTGLGYLYFRCRAAGSDDTCYVHQLTAIAGGADPHDVFSDCYDTHHLPLDSWLDLDVKTPPAPFELNGLLVPAFDTPESVEIRPRWEHRESNLDEATP